MTTPKRKVAITGIGIVSPLGLDTHSTWQNLLAGKNGVEHIKQFDASGFTTHIAAEVKGFSTSHFTNKKRLKQTTPFLQYALMAAQEAFQDAGTRPGMSDAQRWGAVVGSGMMTTDFDYMHRFSQQFSSQGELDIQRLSTDNFFFNVSDFAKTQGNTGLSLLSEIHGIRGYANTVHTACASGGQALGLALQAIQRGDCDSILAGGYDSMITPYGLSSFCLLGALSTENESPETASKPFDYHRNGFVLGEGAAFLILEAWDKATARGANIYAELAGEGNSISAYRITDSPPTGEGACDAVSGSLQHAGLSIEEIDYINAHGTSTKMNDLSETNAIKTVFGARTNDIFVSSTKSQTGHLIAAAGAIEASFCALALHHQTVPMAANLTTPDPECDLNFVLGGARETHLRAVLSNSFGFGGSNSCLTFRHSEYDKAEG